MPEPTNHSSTVLGADAVFKGQLEFEKDVRLLGRFEGEINSGGQLIIEEPGSLTGNATSGRIQVKGQVKGNLDAAQKVELSSSARVEGDLRTARLEVAEGAMLVGHCTVGVPDEGRPKGTAKAPSAPGKPEGGKAKDTVGAHSEAKT
jgi:cytoskeletal protein CcmA (bactofilin family)